MENKLFDFPLILLCGGKSSRMGEPKGLLKIEGKTWLEHHLDSFFNIGGRNLLIQLGFQAELYQTELPWLAEKEQTWTSFGQGKIQTQINPEPERGQFSSIQYGIKALNKCSPKTAAFILPVDLIPLQGEVWHKLAQNMTTELDVCKPIYEGQGGHPVLISHSFQQKLLNIPLEDKGARLDSQIRMLPKNKIKEIAVLDRDISSNINTIDDFQQAKKNYF